MIAINQPFQIGDYVTVGTISGTVRELNMMAATLFTADNIKVLVPNKVIWSADHQLHRHRQAPHSNRGQHRLRRGHL